MALKRERDIDGDVGRPFAKRSKVNPDLVRVWERLADDSEETRLEAAYELISKHFTSTDPETAQKLLGRLFRGLCSGRKSARPGFYAALVGVLSQKHQQASSLDLSLSKVLSVLQAQTTAEAETSKQDERDHHFGRLLGIKAIVEAGLLLQTSDAEWNALLDVIFELMVLKSWLRVEASLIVASCVSSLVQDRKASDQRLVHMLKQLKKHKLIRTSDGLSIWLMTMDFLPKYKLPQDSWKLGNPLNRGELQALKRALLDTRQVQEDDDESSITGTSVWSPRLSLAWDFLLRRLGQKPVKDDVPFEDFWDEVIENGLFSPSSTPERKTLGFLVLQSAVKHVQPSLFRACFSKNLMATMTQALRNPDEAYLKKTIEVTLQDVKQYLAHYRKADVGELIKAFLLGCGFLDFDSVTKTRFVQSLFESSALACDEGIDRDLLDWLAQMPDVLNGISQSAARRNILTILQRVVDSRTHTIKTSHTLTEASKDEALANITKSISTIIEIRQSKEENQFDDETINLFDERCMSMLDSVITIGPKGITAFLDVIRSLKLIELQAEEEIEDAVKTSWKHFSNFRKSARRSEGNDKLSKSEKVSLETSFAALLGLSLLEVYNGDTDAAEMIVELNEMAEDLSDGKVKETANNMIDTVMSLVSKPSKLNRRVGNFAFSGFAAQISAEGLKVLTDLITTKETREGQQALFEDGGDLENEAGSSDADGLDSDVEVLGAGDSEAEESAEEEDEEDNDSQSSSEDDSGDEELNSFESALAAALGTRKFTEADLNDAVSESGSSSSNSDSDMSDSEMMQLDDKLAEVFRNQADQTSAQKQRKEEMKTVKENTVNLKNRALDLIEIFLRTQQGRGLECVALLAALLQMAKETGTPQLSTKGLDMAKSYVQKSKGAKLPGVSERGEARDMLESNLIQLYEMIYTKDVSNAFIDVAAQVNILFCKLLSRTGEKNVLDMVAKLSSRNGERADVKRKALLDFWSRFDAWAADTMHRGQPKSEINHVNGRLKAERKQGTAKFSGKEKKARK